MVRAPAKNRLRRQIRERRVDEILAVVARIGIESRADAVRSSQRDRQITIPLMIKREVDGDSRNIRVDVV